MGLVRLLPRDRRKPSAPASPDVPEPSVVSEPREAFDPSALLAGAHEAPQPHGATDEQSEPEPAVPVGAPAPHAEPAPAVVARTETRVIALANQKGGVAKTTTTLNLGVALTELGHRVLLIDLDPQGNLTMSQGMNPDTIERSMFDVLVHRVPISEIIASAEVDIAVSSIDLAGAELALSAQIGRERALEKALLEVRDRYDFVLIDTPPSLGLLTVNAFVAATGVIVPVQCEYLSLRGLVQLENTLAMVREHLNPRVKVEGIVPTMYDGRTLHAREAIEILEESFGELVFTTKIRKTVRYAEAPVKGSSVLKYDPTGSAAEAYRALARELLGKEASGGTQAREHA
jgi:chromosome partitioning protein